MWMRKSALGAPRSRVHSVSVSCNTRRRPETATTGGAVIPRSVHASIHTPSFTHLCHLPCIQTDLSCPDLT